MAGWDTNAWPTTNGLMRFASTNDYVQVTNLYAKRWVMDISVTSEVDAAGSATMNAWQDGVEWMYSVPSDAVDAVGGGGSSATSIWQKFGVTNTSFPSNAMTITNALTYLTEIRAGYTNHTTFSETNISTNIYYRIFDAYTNTVTEVQTLTGVGIQTNLKLNIIDLWSWDAYQAIEERWAMQWVFNKDEGGSYSIDHPRFYRNAQENMTNNLGIKDFIERRLLGSAFDFWVDRGEATNDLFDIYYTNGNTDIPYYNPTSILVAVGAPSNWFDYTPSRQLGGRGFGVGHTVTSTWTLSFSGGGLSTNTVYDWGGNEWTITGTNGFTTNVVVTNDSIAAGFTTLDYGFKYVDSILNELVWSGVSAAIDAENIVSNSYGTNRWNSTGDSSNSWAEAETFLSTNYSGADDTFYFPAVGLEANGGGDDPNKWNVDAISGGNEMLWYAPATNAAVTNFAADVYFKLSLDDIGWNAHVADQYIFTNFGFAAITEAMVSNLQYYGSVTTALDVTDAGKWVSGLWVGPTNRLAPYIPTMSDPGKTSNIARGWSLGADVPPIATPGRYIVIYRFDVTNGLDYQ